MHHDPALVSVLAELLLAALGFALILRWDAKRYEAERKQWRDRFKNKP